MALTYATSEMLEDYSALESETSAGFNEEMTFKVEDAVINGNGVGIERREEARKRYRQMPAETMAGDVDRRGDADDFAGA